MPEGDTVYRAARRLDGALSGATLTRCDLRVPAFATCDFTGGIVEGVQSRGKHILMHVGDATIHSHLRMEGLWEVYPHGSRWRRPGHLARAVLETRDIVAVGFELGILEVFPRAAEQAELGRLGPDLLGPDWDATEAERRLAADPAVPVAVALLDQSNLAGLGNVYVNELCFLRGLDPRKPIGEVGDLTALVALAHRVIRVNRDRTARVTTGVDRQGQRLWVYGRGGQRCRRCGTRIERGSLGRTELEERVTTWCPHCQPA